MVTATNIRVKANLYNDFTSVSQVSYLMFLCIIVALHCTGNSVILQVSAVFQDISEAFDKVWHPGLLFKLRSYDIEGNLFKLLGS